ncbi:MAG: hypothetical protein R3F39_14180 [Myxococcota bacterium]
MRQGLGFNPDPTCPTARMESDLGIQPRHAYAYLGTTLAQFGECVVALPGAADEGLVSPFDTGSLVDTFAPVCTWPQARRRAFLAACTWPAAALPAQFAMYPGDGPGRIAYLLGNPPMVSGPHECFEGVEVASIWRGALDCRAWLWERRVPGVLPTGRGIVHWSCPSQKYEDIVNSASRHDPEWAIFLEERYVRGGVAMLLQKLREDQVERCQQ